MASSRSLAGGGAQIVPKASCMCSWPVPQTAVLPGMGAIGYSNGAMAGGSERFI